MADYFDRIGIDSVELHREARDALDYVFVKDLELEAHDFALVYPELLDEPAGFIVK